MATAGPTTRHAHLDAGNPRWRVRYNTGQGFAPDGHPRPDAWVRNGGPNSGDRTIRTDLFDVNGDGLPDKVTAQGSSGGWHWDVWYGTGRGFVPTATRWPSPPRDFLRAWDASVREYRYDVLDVNGDGLPDFVDASAWSAANPSGRSTRTPARASPAPCRSTPRRRCGRSTPTPPWRRSRSTRSTSTATAIPTASGFPAPRGRPRRSGSRHPEPSRADALVMVSENPAHQMRFAYQVSTAFNDTDVDDALEDGLPHLPFPVWVVRAIVTDDLDGPADLITTYRYAGGYFDPGRREFRGFHVASQADAYGMTERRRFHQIEPLQGKRFTRASTPATRGRARSRGRCARRRTPGRDHKRQPAAPAPRELPTRRLRQRRRASPGIR